MHVAALACDFQDMRAALAETALAAGRQHFQIADARFYPFDGRVLPLYPRGAVRARRGGEWCVCRFRGSPHIFGLELTLGPPDAPAGGMLIRQLATPGGRRVSHTPAASMRLLCAAAGFDSPLELAERCWDAFDPAAPLRFEARADISGLEAWLGELMLYDEPYAVPEPGPGHMPEPGPGLGPEPGPGHEPGMGPEPGALHDAWEWALAQLD